jgi:4-amino-4-deoxy-L-arabinose transferase-like glycosyltransferase
MPRLVRSTPGIGWVHLLLLGLIVLGAALIRLRYLNEPMRWDEAATFSRYARGSLGTITSDYTRPNNQILYTLLTHFGIKTFGEAIWAVRLVAFAAGVALVPAAFLAARRLYNADAGLWAAALTATFGPLVDYSVNGRGYTLGALFVVLALWLGAKVVDGSNRVTWVGWVLCCVAAVYTLPTMAIGIAAVALWMACHMLRQPRKLALLALAAAAAAGLSLLLYSAVFGQHGWNAVAPTPKEWHSIKALASAVFENWNRTAPHPLDWLVGAAFVASLIAHRRIAKHSIPIAIPTLVVLISALVVGPIAPFVRSWLFLLPLYLIQASGGAAWATQRAGRAKPLIPAAAAVVLAITLLHVGLKTSDVTPTTDNQIEALLRRYVPKADPALIDRYARAPIHYYYFERFGDHTKEISEIRPRDRERGQIIVVVPNGTSPSETVYKAGGIAADTPRLLVRREWISFYDVPLLRHAQPRRMQFHGVIDRPR